MGSSTDRYDSHGREKVECLECGLFFHRLDVHLGTHGLNAVAYRAKHPGAETISEAARKSAVKGQAKRANGPKKIQKVAEPKSAESKPAEDITELNFGTASIQIREPKDVQFIPIHDEKWVPGKSETAELEALAHGIAANTNILIVGPPGVGKSTLVRELAAMVNAPMRYVPVNGELRVSDVLGGDQLRVDAASGQAVTRYEDGPLIQAAEAGHWVLLDEFDSLPNHVGFVLHGALEASRKLSRTNGEPVEFHEDFRVIATANTLGLGDDTGLYAGTAPMNSALLDRFGIVIQMDYPSPEDEAKILVERTGIDETNARQMCALARAVRQLQDNDGCQSGLSPRRLIMWADMFGRIRDIKKAAQYTILNRLSREDRTAVEGLIKRYFSV